MVLKKHPEVQQVAVINREDETVGQRLVAYVITENDEAFHTGRLRQFLQHTLPAYMIPSAFVQLNTMPLTANGKINRRALPEPTAQDVQAAITCIGPRTPLEQQLAGIWAQILKLEQVSIHDNFFELGGHSLLAIKAIARIHDVLQVELTLRQFFDSPTVEGLARNIIQERLGEFNESELVQFFEEIKDK